jgi:hypothetical protein
MPSLVKVEIANDYLRSRKSANLAGAQDGTGNISENSGFESTIYLPVGQQGFNVNGAYWKVMQIGALVQINQIPANAVVTSIDIRYYVARDSTDENFYIEMYAYDYGSYTTGDWNSRATLSTYYGWDWMIATDNTTGVSVGWNDMVVDQANALARFEAARGGTYMEYIFSSRNNRTGATVNTNNEELVELNDSGIYQTEWTFNYIVPDPHPLHLGTVF